MLKKIVRSIKQNIKKPLYNVNHSQHNRTALISYITHPFKGNSLSHTNYFEAISIAKVLDSLGYNVDVIDYTATNIKDINAYDVLIGFGESFQYYYENLHANGKRLITIHYGTGMHVCYQNNATLKRLKDVYRKKKVWIPQSIRYVEKTWTYQTQLVDGILALGNQVCADSYARFYDGLVYPVPCPAYVTQNAVDIISNRIPEADRNFLWFGSSGLIHKGLDLLLEYFSLHPTIQLHICGNIDTEPKFLEAYRAELYNYPNIHVHGFIDISQDSFRQILLQCSFLIFPSCSEGGSPSVANVIVNGGLIPIITTATTIDTAYNINIENLDIDSIAKSINDALSLEHKQIKQLQMQNYNYTKQQNSQDNYYSYMYNGIKHIIEQVNHEL